MRGSERELGMGGSERTSNWREKKGRENGRKIKYDAMRNRKSNLNFCEFLRIRSLSLLPLLHILGPPQRSNKRQQRGKSVLTR